MSPSEKIPESFKKSAEKFFLAGLGALSLAEEKGSRLLDDLVERGRRFEAEKKKPREDCAPSLERVRRAAETCGEKVEKTLEEKVKKVIRKFGVPSRDEIANLTRRVETLMGSVDFLLSREKSGKSPAEKTESDNKSGS